MGRDGVLSMQMASLFFCFGLVLCLFLMLPVDFYMQQQGLYLQ